ncbi:histidine phosphatase family protein [Tistrella bauzanensis]|jgi:probable phosphoglycerate mutase|uniref:Histidine phosphatase family protein n=1 Tax=Tistrella arctica TaxID=3133430 RepID=A0ABU9YI61_9PROT
MSTSPPIILALIRHGRTDWNDQGRLQGQSDQPLNDAGRDEVTGWQLPAPIATGYDWYTSPLLRARETAARLGAPAARPAPALIEMSWGAWEGRRLDDLRLQLGDRMTALEAQGLDFRPPGGESPREVQQRVAPWLAAMAARGRNVAAVSHKGVIRAVMARATGWPMIGKPPHRLARNAAHLFKVAPDGAVAVHHLNLMLS